MMNTRRPMVRGLQPRTGFSGFVTQGFRVGKLLLALVPALLCASCGPHMKVQPSVHPYQRKMPDMPAGTVPTSGRLVTLTLEQARLTKNPLPRTDGNLRLGRIYYGYYCIMCHGEKGDGSGPVAESYNPKPADLTSPSLAKLTDGELYRRMLTGEGHDPVMIQTVPLDCRWPIVMHVRGMRGEE